MRVRAKIVICFLAIPLLSSFRASVKVFFFGFHGRYQGGRKYNRGKGHRYRILYFFNIFRLFLHVLGFTRGPIYVTRGSFSMLNRSSISSKSTGRKSTRLLLRRFGNIKREQLKGIGHFHHINRVLRLYNLLRVNRYGGHRFRGDLLNVVCGLLLVCGLCTLLCGYPVTRKVLLSGIVGVSWIVERSVG